VEYCHNPSLRVPVRFDITNMAPITPEPEEEQAPIELEPIQRKLANNRFVKKTTS